MRRSSVFFLFLMFARTAGASDLIRCAQTATDSAQGCIGAVMGAKRDADGVANRAAASVSDQSLKGAADLEAAITSQISAIYQTARNTCDQLLARCQSACTGENASIARACGQEIGRYRGEATDGRAETTRGTVGSNNSSEHSAGRGATARSNGFAGQGAAAGAARGSGGSLENQYSSTGNLLQRNQADPRSARGSAAARGGSNSPNSGASGGSTSGSGSEESGGGASGFGASGSFGRSRGSNGSSGFGGGQGGADGFGAPGSLVAQALAARCAANPADEACSEVQAMATQRFCAESGNQACPSCRGLTEADLKGENLSRSCSAACVKDPRFGGELANRCREVVQKSLGVPARNVAATALKSGDPVPLLFRIHSEVLQLRCQRRLLTGCS